MPWSQHLPAQITRATARVWLRRNVPGAPRRDSDSRCASRTHSRLQHRTCTTGPAQFPQLKSDPVTETQKRTDLSYTRSGVWGRSEPPNQDPSTTPEQYHRGAPLEVGDQI